MHLILHTNESLPNLYDRSWEDVLGDGSLYKRDSAKKFSIMQYNILAEGLSSGPHVDPPFPRNADVVEYYGGFTEIPNPENVLDFSTRKYRILEEIVKHDADILTLQECDHFYDFFQPALHFLGYDGVFQAKLDSPCNRFGFYSDGVAVFWRREKFSKVCFEGEARMISSAVAVKVTCCIVTLKHINTGNELVVATTHLRAKVNQDSEDKRAAQLLHVLQKGHEIAGERPFILSGDFNTTATATEVDTKPEGTSMQSNRVISMCKMWSKPPLASAYPLATSREQTGADPTDEQSNTVSDDEYTTWKKRKSGEVKRSIDYIWYDKSAFKCVRWLKAPKSTEVESSRFPGLRAPSDHIPIVAELIFG